MKGESLVAIVEIEADRCVVCLAELDTVQWEADRQANVRRTRATTMILLFRRIDKDIDAMRQ